MAAMIMPATQNAGSAEVLIVRRYVIDMFLLPVTSMILHHMSAIIARIKNSVTKISISIVHSLQTQL